MFRKSKADDAQHLQARIRALAGSPSADTPALFKPALFKNGAIKLPSGEVIPVVITALDQSNARIELAAKQELPQRIVLMEPSLKLNVTASVLWQREGAIALRLEPPQTTNR